MKIVFVDENRIYLKEIYDAEKKAADDLFKLQQFRLQVAIDTDKELLDNESASFDNRLEALTDSNQLIQAKLKEQAILKRVGGTRGYWEV